MQRTVQLSEYSPLWPQQFAEYAQQIQKLSGKTFHEVHHIGSTSIPGMDAKPIIDIMLVVDDLQSFDQQQSALEAAGYQWKGEFGIEGRRYMVALAPNGIDHTVHIHTFELGSQEIAKHLYFRDMLRKHEDLAQAYLQLKRQLEKAHSDDRNQYQSKKGVFCEEILKKFYREG